MATRPQRQTPTPDRPRARVASRPRRILTGCLFLLLASALWLPALRLSFPVDASAILQSPGVSAFARSLAARHLRLWSDPGALARELDRMRSSNAEWDFMARTYLVLALANIALRDAGDKPRALAAIDRILDATLRLERELGFVHFSMPYARPAQFRDQPARSLFVDSEIALMLGARRLVAEHEPWREPMHERVRTIAERMSRGPVLSAESYQDECWTFDQANALAALRMADALDGSDHRELCRAWIARAKAKLVEPTTGLLISEYSWSGAPQDGPEGSSIWMIAHALQLVDPALARDQYDRARRELRRSWLGFDFAREWPVTVRGRQDVDSGVVVPIVDASPSSSGLALLSAAAFGDEAFQAGLLRSLELAAFPVRRDGELRYQASNQVGDAVLLYSAVLGPLWAEVERRSWR